MSKADAVRPAPVTVSIKIEMHFLPDVYVPCEVCQGKRYNRETLEVKYKGKSIYDVLEYDGGGGTDISLKMCPSITQKDCRPSMMWDFPISSWDSHLRPCLAARHSVSSWQRS